jgi:Sec-independent protein translocase protein TatA
LGKGIKNFREGLSGKDEAADKPEPAKTDPAKIEPPKDENSTK